MATTNRQFRYYMNIWIVIQAFFNDVFYCLFVSHVALPP